MISIISINQSPNTTTIKQQKIDENVVRIAEELAQNESNYNINPKNVVKVHNYCKTVPVINVNTQKNNRVPNNHANCVEHENVNAQSISNDEYDVDEGFNEDSSSSITSGNNSIVLSTSPISPVSGTSSPTASPTDPTASVSLAKPTVPNLKDLQKLLTINGPTGSVRGKRNSVRTRIQSYKDLIKLANTSKADLQRNYEKEEQNLCVLYTTSMGIIRNTYENCRKLKAILIQNMITFDERDIYINPNFKTELIERTNGSFEVPALFVNGKSIGNLEALERLNECGQLSTLLSDFKQQSNSGKVCECCGGTKFIPCQTCNGSTKSQIHHFVSDSISLKCSQCRRSGLQKCPKCYTNYQNNSNINHKTDNCTKLEV